MGVKGLWQLLEPSGRPVTLESLEGKVLGVDVSLWLNQSVRGMRDAQGNSIPNAHLIGLFNRICKMLFYRIKPVFVFDGGVPLLKKQTLAARRQRLDKAVKESNRARDRLLRNFLKKRAMSSVLGNDSGDASSSKVSQPRSKDIYELPPLDPSQEMELSSDSQNDSWEERQHQQEVIHENFQDLDSIDVESEDFKSLPAEIQHEIILEVKENRKRSSWSTIGLLPKKAHDFSNYQLSNLLKKSKMSQRLGDIRKEMNNRESGEIASMLDCEGAVRDVESQRVVSEDTQHYILIKGLGKKKKSEENGSGNSGSTSKGGDVAGTSSEERLKKDDAHAVSADSFEDVINISDDEMMVQDLELYRIDKPTGVTEVGGTGLQTAGGRKFSGDIKTNSAGRDSVRSDDRMVIVIDDEDRGRQAGNLRGSKRVIDEVDLTGDEEEDYPSKVMKKEERGRSAVVTGNSNDVIEIGRIDDAEDEGRDSGDVIISSVLQGLAPVQVPAQRSTPDDRQRSDKNEIKALRSDPVAIVDLAEPARVLDCVSDVKSGRETVVESLQVADKRLEEDKNGTANTKDEEDSSSEDDFIEITFDPTKAIAEDELFPAEVFIQEKPANPKKSPASSPREVIDITAQYQKLFDARGEDSNDVIVVDAEERDAAVVAKGDEAKEPDVGEISEKSGGESESEEIEIPATVTEWAGKTVEDLETMKAELESEGQVLQAEKNKQERFGVSITDQMYVEAQELMKLFGLPYLVSPQEAEAQCAYLDIRNLTVGTVTDDSDVWLFGGKRVYKNLFNKRKYVEFYTAEGIKSQLLLTRDKMIQVAYLVGSDYTEGIAGVGGVTALELLHEFQGKSLEGLQAFREWWAQAQTEVNPPTETKLKSKMRAVTVKPGFPNPAVEQAYLRPAVDESEEAFQWGVPNLQDLREFANEKFGWSRTKVDEMLLPVMKRLTETNTQTKINAYFPTEFGQPREIKSKRVKRVLNRLLRGDQLADSPTGTQNSEKAETQKGKPAKCESESESESASNSADFTASSERNPEQARKGATTKAGDVGRKTTKGKSIPGKNLRKGRKQEKSGTSASSSKTGKRVVSEVTLSESGSDSD